MIYHGLWDGLATSDSDRDSAQSISLWLDTVPLPAVALTSLAVHTTSQSPIAILKSQQRRRQHGDTTSEPTYPPLPPLSISNGTKRRKLSLPLEGMADSAHQQQLGMANEPRTPPSGKGNVPSRLSAATPSKVSSILNPKAPSDIRSLGDRMTAHGLILNDDAAFDRSPNFQKKVFDIVDRGRVQAPAPASEKKLKAYLEEYDRASEATLLTHIMPILLKDGYYVEQLKPDMSKDQQDGVEEIQATFKEFLIDEGIVINRDEELRGTLLPHKYMSQGFEEEMEKALKKNDKMKNAKPDYIFGITLKKFPKAGPPIPQLVQNLLSIAPGLHHPFFVIEGKGDQGSQAQAIDQCRRGGSTLVHAGRILHEEVSYVRQPQKATYDDGKAGNYFEREDADIDTFVFSATISPAVMKFYVNWYEANQVDDLRVPDPRFHMNLVKAIALEDRHALKNIRTTLHNICEWGANERFEAQKSLHQRILEHSAEVYGAQNEEFIVSGPRKKRKLGSKQSLANAEQIHLDADEELEGRPSGKTNE